MYAEKESMGAIVLLILGQKFGVLEDQMLQLIEQTAQRFPGFQGNIESLPAASQDTAQRIAALEGCSGWSPPLTSLSGPSRTRLLYVWMPSSRNGLMIVPYSVTLQFSICACP